MGYGLNRAHGLSYIRKAPQPGRQAREVGVAWEALPDPRPPFNLEIFSPIGEREYFLLGPHAPNLTSNEVNLVHQLWLRLGDLVNPEEVHHHDVVHFALDELKEKLTNGNEEDVADRFKKHLTQNKTRREPPLSHT